jgi:hypothetical protein
MRSASPSRSTAPASTGDIAPARKTGKTGTRTLTRAGEPYARQSGKARVTAAVRLETCSLV